MAEESHVVRDRIPLSATAAAIEVSLERQDTHNAAKNLVGAFYQPRAVISCLEFLETLGRRQARAGLAEALKKAIIALPELVEHLERHADDLVHCHSPAVGPLVGAASTIKPEPVGRDPRETDLRRPPNFGHPARHAVETTTGYGPVPHGEVVAFGMPVSVGATLITEEEVRSALLLDSADAVGAAAASAPVAGR